MIYPTRKATDSQKKVISWYVRLGYLDRVPTNIWVTLTRGEADKLIKKGIAKKTAVEMGKEAKVGEL